MRNISRQRVLLLNSPGYCLVREAKKTQNANYM